MPIAGSVGAIKAGQRAAARRRQGNLQGHSSVGIRSAAFKPTPVPRKPVNVSDCDAISVTSVDSKSSVLTKLKQQVEETGSFFKKKQQAFVDKVQKGIKMASNAVGEQKTGSNVPNQTTGSNAPNVVGEQRRIEPAASNEQKGSSSGDSRPPADPQAEARESLSKKHAEWIEQMEQMGFDRSEVQQALLSLGTKARQIEDVVQVLVAKPKRVEAAVSGGASSSDMFSITVRKSATERLGIVVDASRPQLTVEDVSDGLVSRWNAANPYLCVKAGDVILDVNGKKGSHKELVEELMSASSVTMSISTRYRKQYIKGSAPAPKPSSPSTASGSASTSMVSGGYPTMAASSVLPTIASGSTPSASDAVGGTRVAVGEQLVEPELQEDSEEQLVEEFEEAPPAVTPQVTEQEAEDHVSECTSQAALVQDAASDVSDAAIEVMEEVHQEEKQAMDETSAEADEHSVSELAAKVIQAVVAKASERLLNREAVTPPKHVVEERFTTSPMHGGA